MKHILPLAALLSALAALSACATQPPAQNAATAAAAADPTASFAGKWGVFIHFLDDHRAGKTTPESWNKRVDAFDVQGLAQQLHEVGASYLVITIGQGSGYFCAPNAEYDRLTGCVPSKCSRRDLIADLHAALEPHGIRLMVYSAADLAWGDPQTRAKLGLKHHHNDPGTGGKNIWKQNRQVEFMRHIEAINLCWAKQWGDKVSGWWIDGCYLPEFRFIENSPPNFATFKTALRAGNPQAIVCFNNGVPGTTTTRHEDYIAGENDNLKPCAGAWIEKDGHRARYHSLSYLGTTWFRGEKPRFTDARVADFTRKTTALGGFVTWDVPYTATGLIPEPFMAQLRAVRDATAQR